MSENLTLPQAATIASNELNNILWEAFPMASLEVDSRLQGVPERDYPFLRPLFIRPFVRSSLLKQGLPAGWALGGNTRLMGQTFLTKDNIKILFLKECDPTFPGGVPAAGRNHKRKLYWQPPLDIPTPGATPGVGTQINLLLLWDYRNPDNHNEGITLRLVHTTGTGRYRQKTPNRP
ncbi:hypothetical protein QP400_06370 [Winkia sp. UMB3158]|jgi:hypothetical protein|nr:MULTISPECIES: hypothetical protein [Winkia]MDK8340984.1 hypothetical protein [Winkia sp. UMB3164B]OFK02865.1 hypothetical protein HMPREF2835_01605 [Actinomyces sp. HMSC072A03]KWZ75453.1 hypothetical protein HMPREF3198_00064 [Winkia neuii]MDK7149749.1 hypothetical protein [Winkia sp. UMB3158]MDK7163470.1 hypothetical protein [Winkia sp. UMB3105]